MPRAPSRVVSNRSEYSKPTVASGAPTPLRGGAANRAPSATETLDPAGAQWP